MTTSSHAVPAVLAVLLAVLSCYHLHLNEKYQQLVTSCENKYRNDRQEVQTAKSANEKFDQGGTKGSFFMHSSLKREDNEVKRFDEIDADGYMEEYEPTVYDKQDDGRNVYVTLSSSLSQQGDRTVSETSAVDSTRTKPNVDAMPFKGSSDAFTPQMEAATSDGHADIHPSQGPSLQLTQNSINPSQSTDSVELEEQKISQDMHVHHSISTNVDKSIHVEKKIGIDSSEKLDTLDESTNEITTKTDSAFDQVLLTDLFSSQSTEEEEVLVLETSSQNIVPEDVNYEHKMHFDTQDSTQILNTAHHGESLSLQADVTDFVESMEGIKCGSYGCDFEEKLQYQPSYSVDFGIDDDYYDDDDDYEIHNNGKNEISSEEAAEELVVRLSSEESKDFAVQGTSAWCNRDPLPSCTFHNLCYHTQERDFIFFRGEKSQLHMGEQKNTEDMFEINLSTIQGHNTQMFSMVTLSSEYADTFSMGVVGKRAVAMNRFKPDNIMHVLHDDILPLHETLNHLRVGHEGDAFDVAIVFTDVYEDGSYIDLYSSLSAYRPFSLWKLNKTYDLLCFSKIQVGLQTSTLWYQYGFFKPQGPINPVHENIVEKIQRTSTFLSSRFQSDCFFCKQGNYLVFLRRKDNRLIVNDGELIMAVTRSTRLKVMSVSLESQSLSEIITTIRLSRGMFGMHGSLLSLAIFLPPGSILIELFPFAVDPFKYTPFKTYSDLAQTGITYKAWANPSPDKSVPHPDRAASEGGIQHLPKSEQEEIISQTDVPEHLCCQDPSWLYHIYQDTHVDVKEVSTLVVEALHQAEGISNLPTFHSTNSAVSVSIPGSVKNLQCENDKDGGESQLEQNVFTLSWDAPWTFVYEEAPTDYKYEIVIQDDGKESSAIVVPGNQLSHRFESKPVTQQSGTIGDANVNVWVRVLAGGKNKSQYKFVRCVR